MPTPLPAPPPRWLWEERKWNPALHPRGPDGRFTKSSARLATPAQRKRIDYVRKRPKRKPFKNPKEAASALRRVSTVPAVTLSRLGETNRALRSGKPAPDKALAAAMKPIPEPMVMFRSVPRSEFGSVAPEDLRGFVVRDAGFFPASAAPTMAQPGEVRMTVDVPAGTVAAGSPDTHELVLDAGTELSVDEVTTTPDGSTEMHLTALPPEGAEGAEAPDGAVPEPTPDPAPDEPDPAADFNARVEAALRGDDARRATPGSMIGDRSRLNSRQYRALDGYRGIDYSRINGTLREGVEPTGSTARLIAGIDSAMEENRLAEEVQVWRGLDGPGFFGNRLDGDLTGMEWSEAAYVSTSSERSVSQSFADGNRPVLMRIITPAGVGAVELSDSRPAGSEAELLLQRGLRMRIVADNGVDERGIRQIDVEVVPDDAG